MIPLYEWRDRFGRCCPVGESRIHKSLFCEAQIRQQHLGDQAVETVLSLLLHFFFFLLVLSMSDLTILEHGFVMQWWARERGRKKGVWSIQTAPSLVGTVGSGTCDELFPLELSILEFFAGCANSCGWPVEDQYRQRKPEAHSSQERLAKSQVLRDLTNPKSKENV